MPVKPKSRKTWIAHNFVAPAWLFENFAQYTAVIPPGSLQNFRTIGRLSRCFGRPRFREIWVLRWVLKWRSCIVFGYLLYGHSHKQSRRIINKVRPIPYSTVLWLGIGKADTKCSQFCRRHFHFFLNGNCHNLIYIYWGLFPRIPLTLNGYWFNTLGPRQNGHHFADDIFKYIFLNENVWISIEISLKFAKVSMNNIPTLVQIMAWCRLGDKLLSEPMMFSLPTHICVTRPLWVKTLKLFANIVI